MRKQQRQTLFFFLDVLARLCVEVVDITTLDSLEVDVHRSLSLLERDFPVSLHVSVFHLLHHLPFYIRRFGPLYSFWMYPFERFNSWIIRRVHNRRYPEATVTETYRLCEWAHCLQMSGRIPDDAILYPGDEQDEYGTAVQIVTQLNSVQFIHLQDHYRQEIREYNDFCLRYETERKRAQVQHQLSQFPSISCWTPVHGPQLTQEEKEMQAFCSDITVLYRYAYRSSHGRKVILTGKDGDTKSSTSSFVFTRRSDGSFIFGQVEFIFVHTFCGKDTTFAFVNWFCNPKKDADSGLMYVKIDSTSTFNPVILVSKLSGPLVTAVDRGESSKLWILTFI